MHQTGMHRPLLQVMAKSLARHSWQVHYLSGPVAVTDGSGAPAHPGDILVVRDAGPLVASKRLTSI